ncbi:UNVERIFIED_CONTAM: Thioredoxin H9 [Sesamum calycinum]|uniref:Thioredoxin H9 n=1 Tax=Sesamum calycinum TaxID=2727403 RepID=A0AAW2JZI2_9LAMI
MQHNKGGGDDSDHNVEFAGGNVHVITTIESWEQKIAEANRDGKILSSLMIPYHFRDYRNRIRVHCLYVGMPSGPASVGYSFSVSPSSRSVDSLIEGMKAKVIANFSATWCGPCKMIAPYYVELSEKHPSIMFLTVDVDELTDFSTSWDIKATPTFFFLKDGQQFDKTLVQQARNCRRR